MIAAGGSSPTRRWIRNNLRFARDLLSRPRSPAVRMGRTRVILLCGWSLTSGTMSTLAGRLESDGFSAEILPLGGLFGRLNTKAVEDSASHLMQHLRSTAAGGERVAIVGHSLGGIIARYAVCCLGGHEHVHTLITLGSPHGGSPVARVARVTPLRWISKSVLELNPGSDFMRRIEAAPIPPSVYCASFFSETDDMCPRPCAEIDIPSGADNVVNVDVGAYGHFELAADECVFRMIEEELKRGIERSATI
jgi:triacylglycerol lipase